MPAIFLAAMALAAGQDKPRVAALAAPPPLNESWSKPAAKPEPQPNLL